MKRISIFLAFVSMTSSVFAANVTVEQTSQCIEGGPIILTAQVTNATGSVRYRWQQKLEGQWITITDSARSQLVITSISERDATYRSMIDDSCGQYYSLQVCIYKCIVLDLKIQSFTGSVAKGKVRLKWSVTDANRLFLQASSDQMMWQETEVTGRVSSEQPLVTTTYFRLRAVSVSGQEKFSDIKVLKTNIDPRLPIDIRYVSMDGKRSYSARSADTILSAQLLAQKHAPQSLSGVYIVSFYQQGAVIETFKFLKR